VLAVATFLVAVAALAALRPRRGCAAFVESVARTLVVIPSPSKRLRGAGSTATLRVDRVVPAAAPSPRYRPGEPAAAASWRRTPRLSWSAMSWPALPVLLARWSIHGASKSTSRPETRATRRTVGDVHHMRTITRNAAWGHCIVPRQGIPKYRLRHARPHDSNAYRTEKVAVGPLQAHSRCLVVSSVIASRGGSTPAATSRGELRARSHRLRSVLQPSWHARQDHRTNRAESLAGP